MERKCIVCGDSKVYVDVYDSKTIVQHPWPRKSDVAPPKHYCEKHFFECIWNKKGNA